MNRYDSGGQPERFPSFKEKAFNISLLENT